MIVERFLNWAETAPTHLRAKAAAAMAKAYLTGRFSSTERDDAEAALTLLADDPELEVRLAVADMLSRSPDAPRHIMTMLIADQPEVAMPVLARSPVFIDAELVDIVATGSPAQQIAIACRNPVSAAISAAVAEVGVVEAIVALLMNESAKVSPPFLHRIAERHLECDEVQKQLAERDDLQPGTRLLLLEKAGERLREKYAAREWLPDANIDAMVREQFDKAVISFAATISQSELQALIGELIRTGRLSTAFMLRAVCLGNISMFASALSQLARVPFGRVEAILGERPGNAFTALYKQAGLPDAAYGVFADLLDAWRRRIESEEEEVAEKLPCLVMREVLATYRNSSNAKLDGLLVLLRSIAAETERENARMEINRIAERARNRARPSLAPPGEGEVELPAELYERFAVHFAEEIVELESELAAELEQEIAARISADDLVIVDLKPDEPGPPANDDMSAASIIRYGRSKAA
jgi:uncharacterized protein (DUF2336 family)